MIPERPRNDKGSLGPGGQGTQLGDVSVGSKRGCMGHSDVRNCDPSTGKRLWFSNEIQIVKNPTAGANDYIALDTPVADDELKKWVFNQPSDNIRKSDGTFVGLSTAAFISTILDNAEISASFDRGAFRAIFDILRSIIISPQSESA